MLPRIPWSFLGILDRFSAQFHSSEEILEWSPPAIELVTRQTIPHMVVSERHRRWIEP